MVCNRCIMVVKHEFEALGYPPLQVELGEVEINSELNSETITDIDKHLQTFGFEIIDNTKSRIIEKIKNTVVQLIHHSNDDLKVNYSTYIEAVLKKDYNYLSNLFSEIEGTTIEKYIINQKIEKVKELLVYDELNLSQIADKMGYSNVAHLSAQFHKVTGLTPTHFKQIKENKRKPLDEV
jgi:YesN/AraC family two-component response regulator